MPTGETSKVPQIKGVAMVNAIRAVGCAYRSVRRVRQLDSLASARRNGRTQLTGAAKYQVVEKPVPQSRRRDLCLAGNLELSDLSARSRCR
jgi:hypothetical protein